MAACAAAPMCFGVGKSGSPAPKSITSTPWAFSFMASAATFMVGDTPIRFVRSDNIRSGPQGFPRELLVAQSLFHAVRHEPVDRSPERDHFLHQARAHVRIRLGR